MSPLIADGIYRIHNVAFSERAVDLIGGVPSGPVSGFLADDNSLNQRWRIHNDSENKITIESIAAPLQYVNAPVHAFGIALDSSPNPTIWNVVPVVSNGDARFSIQTPDGKSAWGLLANGNYASILLLPVDNANEELQWTIQPM